MDEPLYGFIVEVTVSQNQTCQISPSSEENIMQQCQLLGDDNENDIEIDSEECSDHYCLNLIVKGTLGYEHLDLNADFLEVEINSYCVTEFKFFCYPVECQMSIFHC